ncbi:MAG: diacylglycerol kinase family protein [Atopostipes suicloacalis]|nr:diacylglycerol kinase family protein [Atopostipes suicloacalis]
MVLRDKNSMNNPYKNRNFFDSFRYAFEGVATAFKEERNMRFHVFSAIAVVISSYFLSLSIAEWLWIILITFLVIIMEVLNTVIENLTDLVSPDYHPLAKKVKDMAAALVLITSFLALVIGGIILLPKLIELFN